MWPWTTKWRHSSKEQFVTNAVKLSNERNRTNRPPGFEVKGAVTKSDNASLSRKSQMIPAGPLDHRNMLRKDGVGSFYWAMARVLCKPLQRTVITRVSLGIESQGWGVPIDDFPGWGFLSSTVLLQEVYKSSFGLCFSWGVVVLGWVYHLSQESDHVSSSPNMVHTVSNASKT